MGPGILGAIGFHRRSAARSAIGTVAAMSAQPICAPKIWLVAQQAQRLAIGGIDRDGALQQRLCGGIVVAA